MSYKSLIGYLLIAGPILTFLFVGILYDAIIGPGETNADAVREAMDKAQTARLLGMIGMIVFVSTFAGMALLARSMTGDAKPGSPYATLAMILFVGVTGLSMLASGLGLGAMDIANESGASDAAIVGLVGDGIFGPMFVFWGIANLFIGAAMLIQKNLHQVVAYLFVGWGLFMIIISAIEAANIPDAVGLVLWAGLNLTMVAAGILTLRSKEAS